jgi:hypothetical protein
MVAVTSILLFLGICLYCCIHCHRHYTAKNTDYSYHKYLEKVKYWLQLPSIPRKSKSLPFERRKTYCFSLDFFFRFRFFCFFSAKLVRTITFLSFQIGQLYLVCGCMTIRWCVMYHNDQGSHYYIDYNYHKYLEKVKYWLQLPYIPRKSKTYWL